MSRLPVFLLVAVLLPIFCPSAHAGDWRHRLLFGAQSTACVASAFDGATTSAAVGIGAHETNPWLVKSGTSELRMGRLIGTKAAFCAAPIIIAIVAHHKVPSDRNADITGFIPALTSTGYYTWAGIHNLGVIHEIHAQNPARLK
jgi:hypothetical protein